MSLQLDLVMGVGREGGRGVSQWRSLQLELVEGGGGKEGCVRVEVPEPDWKGSGSNYLAHEILLKGSLGTCGWIGGGGAMYVCTYVQRVYWSQWRLELCVHEDGGSDDHDD